MCKDLEKISSLYCDIVNSKPGFNVIGHIRCGIGSNIPICCILFFILREILYYFIHFKIVKYFIYNYPPRGKEYYYIPCFICFVLGRVRKVNICSEDDANCCLSRRPFYKIF